MAWRDAFVKERANVWQQSHGQQTSGSLNRLWHCLLRSVKEGNEVILSVCADGRNSWECTSGQARHCSFGTPFSLCKCDDAVCQNQSLLARHCSLLSAPSHASAEIMVRFCLHVAATHLCSSAVSRWLLAVSFPLKLSRYLEKSVCPVVFSLIC